jgi:hypothetical protein
MAKLLCTFFIIVILIPSLSYSEIWYSWFLPISENSDSWKKGEQYASEQMCYGDAIRQFKSSFEELIKSGNLPEGTTFHTQYYPPINSNDNDSSKYPFVSVMGLHVDIKNNDKDRWFMIMVQCLPNMLDMNFIVLKRKSKSQK